MLALLFLASIFFNGLFVFRTFTKKTSGLLIISGAFISGMLLTVTLIYILANFLRGLEWALLAYFVFELMFLSWILFRRSSYAHIFSSIHFEKSDVLFLPLTVLFYLLFKKSFTYDAVHGSFLIASNLYVDFGAHIPFIRSFSFGNNFPSEVPFFADSGLLYHFLFDFSAGLLEFLGMRLDLAFNLLSALSLSCVFIMIYMWGRAVGRSKITGILACLLFFFQSSLAFIDFIKNRGLSLSALLHNNFYVGNFPFENGLVAGFWNINTYLNQRQLIFGLASVLFFSYILFHPIEASRLKRFLPIWIGVSIGFLSFWHVTAFLSLIMIMIIFFFVDKEKRKDIFVTILFASVVSFPWLLRVTQTSNNQILFQPGFLIDFVKEPGTWLQFWLVNLGVSSATIIAGLFCIPPEKRKLALAVLPLFIIPNVIHISGRFPFDDHKFFNIWIVFMNTFSAACLVFLFKKNFVEKSLSIMLLGLLTLSGVVNAFVVKNDVYAVIPDYPSNKFMHWSRENIPSNKRILTNGEIYDPLSLIGKKVYLGRVQYIYVYGGDTYDREWVKRRVFASKNPAEIKKLLQEEKIARVVVYKDSFAKNSISVDTTVFEMFMQKVYEDKNAVVFSL